MQYCCWCTCQILKWQEHFNNQSHTFESLWDLMIRCLMWYWIGPQTIPRECKYIFVFPHKYSVHKGLTHQDQVRHTCINKQHIIGSDKGLLPVWCQAIIWTKAGLILVGSLGTNFSEINIYFHLNDCHSRKYTFENVIYKMSAILYHLWPSRSYLIHDEVMT